MSGKVSIGCRGLQIGYGKRAVQQDVTFDLFEGELVALLGRNGCGKSTLLRTLAGLQPPLSGQMQSPQSAIVLTERLTLDNTTVREVVAMGRYPYTSLMGKLSPEDEQIVTHVMEQVGIETLQTHLFNALSDGEKQRVLIAKALAQTTSVILLDEPTAHLDLPNRISVMDLLRDLAHEQGKTILISTHELDLALKTADRILLMSEEGIRLDKAEVLIADGAFEKAFGIYELGIKNYEKAEG